MRPVSYTHLLTMLFIKYVVRDNISHGITRVLYAISTKNSKLKAQMCIRDRLKIQQDEDYKPEFTPELQTDSGKDGEEENSGVFTETLARIYICLLYTSLSQAEPQRECFTADRHPHLCPLTATTQRETQPRETAPARR